MERLQGPEDESALSDGARQILHYLEALQSQGHHLSSFCGFRMESVLASPPEQVTVVLRRKEERVVVWIQRLSRADKYYIASQDCALTYPSEAPLDTPDKRRALALLAQALDRRRG